MLVTYGPRKSAIKATHMPGGWIGATSDAIPALGEGCYLAVSATILQGEYNELDLRDFYWQFLAADPKKVLGGSIYIYEMPLTPKANQQR
jgi:hypothetical protein